MEPWIWILIAVAVVAAVAVVLVRLRGGDERRLERHADYQLRDLDDDERDRYADRWRTMQRTSTRQPATGLLEADGLLTAVLADVGYPTDSFEQQAADLSVEHAEVVEDYRAGRAVVADMRGGRAGTEEIRRALVRYRTVFERVAGTAAHDDEEVS